MKRVAVEDTLLLERSIPSLSDRTRSQLDGSGRQVGESVDRTTSRRLGRGRGDAGNRVGAAVITAGVIPGVEPIEILVASSIR
jgi:hypothetical protein